MNERELIATISLIVVITCMVSAYYVIEDSEDMFQFSYVGDIETKKVCTNTKTNVNNINSNHQIFFTSIQQADKLSFIYSKDCICEYVKLSRRLYCG